MTFFDAAVAARYDDPADPMNSPDVIGPAVDALAGLAAGGAALEFAIGTGRIAVPLFDPSEPGHVGRLHAVLDDCRPSAILTTTAAAEGVRKFFRSRPANQRPRVIAVDAVHRIVHRAPRSLVLSKQISKLIGVSH